MDTLCLPPSKLSKRRGLRGLVVLGDLRREHGDRALQRQDRRGRRACRALVRPSLARRAENSPDLSIE